MWWPQRTAQVAPGTPARLYNWRRAGAGAGQDRPAGAGGTTAGWSSCKVDTGVQAWLHHTIITRHGDLEPVCGVPSLVRAAPNHCRKTLVLDAAWACPGPLLLLVCGGDAVIMRATCNPVIWNTEHMSSWQNISSIGPAISSHCHSRH